MSLRLRILLAFVLVLVSGSGVGLALAGLEARQWLRDELWTAQLSAHLQVDRAFSDLQRAEQPPRSMVGLVATFSGNRHLQAVLVDPAGRVVAASQPAPAGAPAPAWFAGLMRPDIPTTRLAIPGAGGAAVELRPLYADDAAEMWTVFTDIALVLALAMAGGGVAVFALVTWALRPLTTVGRRVLPRIGGGDYAVRAPEQGPPEIVALSRGVNEMAGRLAAMRERNRALEEQILTLQDEERADIARDLHDEIGPHLFAANVDTAMAVALIGGGKAGEALAPVRRAGVAIGHIQRLVRDILGRLRPTHLAELGLSTAILDLVAFWSARRPEIAFETELPGEDESLPDPVNETLYRLVQESLSNAVRHGAPTSVRIVIRREDDAARAEVVNDGAPDDAARGPGYRLTGMAERVAAAGGTLTAGPAGEGRWRVAATLPLKALTREEAA